MVIEEIMRVLIVTEAFRWPVNGVAVSIANMIKALMALGVAIHVVAPKTENDSNELYVTRVNSFVSWLNRNYPFMLPWIKLWRLNAFSVDVPSVIHVHHPFCAGLVALWAARHWDIPLVATCHTYYPGYLHYMPGGNLWQKPLAMWLRSYYDKCDRVIVPSQFTHDWLISIGVKTPIEVIPTGVSSPDYRLISHSAGSKVRASYGIPADAPLLVTVCRLTREKNLELLVRVFEAVLADLPTVHLLIVGEGRLYKKLSALSIEPWVAGRIHVIGSLPHSKVSEVFAASDLNLSFGWVETQGLSGLEARVCGVPSVVFDRGGAPESVIDGITGMVLPSDFSHNCIDIGLVIAGLLRDSRMLEQMGKNCLIRRHECSPEAMVSKLLAVYRDVVIKRSRN